MWVFFVARSADKVPKHVADERVRLQGLRVKNLELEHFLLEPMQRVTRYPLLISHVCVVFQSLCLRVQYVDRFFFSPDPPIH